MALPLRPNRPWSTLLRTDHERIPVCAVPIGAYGQSNSHTLTRDAVFLWRQGRMSGQEMLAWIGLATFADLCSIYANDRVSQAVPAHARRTD